MYNSVHFDFQCKWDCTLGYYVQNIRSGDIPSVTIQYWIGWVSVYLLSKSKCDKATSLRRCKYSPLSTMDHSFILWWDKTVSMVIRAMLTYEPTAPCEHFISIYFCDNFRQNNFGDFSWENIDIMMRCRQFTARIRSLRKDHVFGLSVHREYPLVLSRQVLSGVPVVLSVQVLSVGYPLVPLTGQVQGVPTPRTDVRRGRYALSVHAWGLSCRRISLFLDANLNGRIKV